jgi:hypothetical protein
VVPSARSEIGAAGLVSANDHRWLWARFETACSLVASQVETVGAERAVTSRNAVQEGRHPINAWQLGTFQAVIGNVTARREARLLVLSLQPCLNESSSCRH